MSEPQASIAGFHGAGRYEIRVKGGLESRWAGWFDGLSLSHATDGITLIHGPVADQAALYGLLQRVRDTGLPLLSVSHVDGDRPDARTVELR